MTTSASSTTFLFAPAVPSWATHIIHDLTAFKRRPLPVAEFEPFALPARAYFEYAFQDARGAYRPDPANDEIHNPWYDFARSVSGPAYTPGRFNLHGPDLGEPQGTLERGRLRSTWLGRHRRYLVYTPQEIAPGTPLPSVYVQDGLGFLYYGRLPQTLDAMIAAQVVPPVRLVLIPPEKREVEYPHNEAYQRFVTEELVPHVEATYPCIGRRVALGASLGGLVSVLIARRRPDLFGVVTSFSGAFLTAPESPHDHHGGREWLREQLLAGGAGAALANVRFVLYSGGLEWLTAANRRVAEALSQRGIAHEYFERPAGHNWVNWRDGFDEALRAALAERNR